MTTSKTVGKMRIWGCGGAGVNLAARFYQQPPQEHFADLSVCMVDTSRSNLNSVGDISEQDVYLISAGEKDGAGKVRKDIHQQVVDALPEIMGKFNHGDFHVVLFSASGGSGSVIGSLVLAELVKRGQAAVGIVVGSHESTLTATNTVRTIQGLDNLARSTIRLPIVVAFHNNHENTHKTQVDEAIAAQISELAVLVSRQHHGLDTSDILSWLRFDRTTSVPAQLALFDICDSTESVNEIPYPIGIASLLAGDSNIGTVGAEYFCDGKIAKAIAERLETDELHFVINVTQVPLLYEVFNKAETALRERNAARPKHQGLAGNDPDATSSGLIL